MLSINTNQGSLNAHFGLTASAKEKSITQSQLSTGKTVSSAKDNAAVLAIAQKMLGDIGGLSSVSQSIDRASSTVDVALAATEEVSNLLIDMKAALANRDAAKLSGDTTSENAYNAQLGALQDSIKDTVKSASFNGTNLIDGSGSKVSAILNAEGSETFQADVENLADGADVLSLSGVLGCPTDALCQAIDTTNSALSQLGSASSRLENQKVFTTKLSDAIEVGVSRLVDADMSRTSANHQANQVKEQLGILALNIANQSPKSVLSLFGG